MSWNYYESKFRPYVPMAVRREKAQRTAAKMLKKGRTLAPVTIKGQTITHSFWGKAWCKHLESFSDFSNRLPRGRSYVRNGSVIDLRMEREKIQALVMGSSLYEITIGIKALPSTKWKRIRKDLSGNVTSLVDLLSGRIPDPVMHVISDPAKGLFPRPGEIGLACTCPDWAGLCKHLAAVLYAVGARLDHEPELLFLLRGVDPVDLVEDSVAAIGENKPDSAAALAGENLSDIFGIALESSSGTPDESAKSIRRKSGSRTPAKKATRRNALQTKRVKTTTAKKTLARKTTQKTATREPSEKGPIRKNAKMSPSKTTTAKKAPSRKIPKGKSKQVKRAG